MNTRGRMTEVKGHYFHCKNSKKKNSVSSSVIGLQKGRDLAGFKDNGLLVLGVSGVQPPIAGT